MRQVTRMHPDKTHPKNSKRLAAFLFILSFALASTVHAAPEDYQVTPTPAWVEETSSPDTIDQEESARNGVSYRLVEEQYRITDTTQERFVRYIDKALNTSGVSTISRISINFDPEYQTLALHTVRLHRDGEIIDMRDRSKISLLQREKDLEHQIYDGSKTLNLFVEDVRVGDSIEYSFTITGANPVYSGHFYRKFMMQWSVPVDKFHYRIIWETERQLYIKKSGENLDPGIRERDNSKEYAWVRNRIEGVDVDDNTPDWYNPYPEVYLSDFPDWNRVAQWALPLYETQTASPQLQSVIDNIKKDAKSDEGRILGALNFVQNEIRYLGIEMGERSHKPNTPDAVINQRFGDCKDKSRLLTGLLRGMDIEASPVLVNTDNGHGPSNALPSPRVFNHVIVQVKHAGQTYWLDPTRTNQKGLLGTLYQPDYDYALVISEETKELEKMSDDIDQVHSKLVEESFNLTDKTAQFTDYRIESRYSGYYADALRDQLATSNIKEIEQTYLNYTATWFPGAELAASLKIEDAPRNNAIQQVEQYRIPDIWEVDKDGLLAKAYFTPYLINDHVKSLTTPVRSMPYTISHPVRYRHITRIRIPDAAFEDERIEVEDKAFRYLKTASYANNVLVIEYLYESLADHVAAADIETYANNIRNVKELNEYSIQMPNPAIQYGDLPSGSDDINWSVIVYLLLFLVLVTVLIYRYIYLYDPILKSPGEIDTELEGIGGWLILPLIGMFLAIISLVVTITQLTPVFSEQQLAVIMESYGSSYEIVLAVSIAANLALIVMLLFLLVMFFTRRNTFPRIYIGFMIVSMAITVIDLASIHFLDFPGVEIEQTDIRSLIRQIVSSAIWIAYFLQSKRVKATFTRRLSNREPGDEPTDPARLIEVRS